LAAYPEKIAQWQKSDEGKAATEKLKAWQKAASEAKAAGKTPPVRPHPPTSTPQEPLPPDGGPYAPTTLYNAMIAPLIPFAIKGVAWYQGEANHAEGKAYRTLFGNMISDWREKWGEGDFPFVFVQLAALDKGKGSIQSLPCVRESQLKTLSLPNTGMAVTVDIGNPHNIHPTDKVDVGHRLALAARYVAYDEKLVYSGPIYDAMKISGNKITVTFTQTGSGLIVGSAPWVPPGQDPLPTDKLMGFEIAGADHKWVPADARIEEDAIVVSSPQVPAPVAVRYDWANAPKGNFYNKEKLPASPFRTDDWPDPIAEGHITSSGDSSPAVKE
jgi:sialate O-acetylesterase